MSRRPSREPASDGNDRLPESSRLTPAWNPRAQSARSYLSQGPASEQYGDPHSGGVPSTTVTDPEPPPCTERTVRYPDLSSALAATTITGPRLSLNPATTVTDTDTELPQYAERTVRYPDLSSALAATTITGPGLSSNPATTVTDTDTELPQYTESTHPGLPQHTQRTVTCRTLPSDIPPMFDPSSPEYLSYQRETRAAGPNHALSRPDSTGAWNMADENRLIGYVEDANLTWRQIAERLGRTYKSVMHRAFRLHDSGALQLFEYQDAARRAPRRG